MGDGWFVVHGPKILKGVWYKIFPLDQHLGLWGPAVHFLGSLWDAECPA